MRQEKRTRSEFVREALREYLETRDFRAAAKRRFFDMVDQVQERTKDIPEEEINQLVDEAVTAVRRKRKSA